MFSFLKKIAGGGNDATQQAITNGAIIIDVRTPAEYNTGHITGSKNIPLDILKPNIAMIKKWQKPVITVCRSGARSGMAKSILSAAGIQTINGGPWTSLDNSRMNQPKA